MPDAPPFPDQIDYLWQWYLEIETGLAANGMTIATISWRDLAAWCELTGTELESWEVRLIIRLSGLRAEIQSEKTDGPKGQDRSG